MSAVPTEIELDERRSNRSRPPLAAVAYYLLVAGVAIAAAAPLVGRLAHQHEGWLALVVFGACAAVAQLFVVVTPRRGQRAEGTLSYHATAVFLLPIAILVSPPLAVLAALVQHVPEWVRKRTPWYIATFNIFNYTITILATLGVYRWLEAQDAVPTPGLRTAIAGTAACVAFVVVNHTLLATMFRLGRGITVRDSGLFGTESLLAELVFAALGVGIATFWDMNPWLIPIALAPLLLINRSLSVPALQMEARVDPKTGLFNTRHFSATLAEELTRAQRFERPLSLMMLDLDLLRDINNKFGHLAGDAVLRGVADVLRRELRQYDIPARFGGEEFSIILPETAPEQAFEIAERIRRALSASRFEVETSPDPISATISIGVASYPADGQGPEELIHQADLAVYSAKLQGRNRAVAASAESMLLAGAHGGLRVVPLPEENRAANSHVPAVPAKRREPAPRPAPATPAVSMSLRLAGFVALVSLAGLAAGVAGVVIGSSVDLLAMLVLLVLVVAGQALALEADERAISVSAVGVLAGAALFGPRVALPLAVAIVIVDWSARGIVLRQVFFNIGALSLAALAAVGVFAVAGDRPIALIAAGVGAGTAYFLVHAGLNSRVLAAERGEPWRVVFCERFLWLLPHYAVYGFIGSVMATAYVAAGLVALAIFTVPLLLMRRTQESYLSDARSASRNLREAAETIQGQNASLEQANRLLKERSTAAMETLSATVEARDASATGHSRRVQQLALAVGRELDLSQAELDLLGHAALFHDIGKLSVPDAILLKPATLSASEWNLVRGHAEAGARIIERLGFLGDAVPAIKHHHERYDGGGYPDGLRGEEIPLGARIILVADALDSMLTSHVYRGARPAEEAVAELRRGAGTQFCPRCVAALERALAIPPAALHHERMPVATTA